MNAFLKKILFVFLILLCWQLICHLFSVPEYLFPGPLSIIEALILNFRTVLNQAIYTLVEAVTGFLLANTLSVFIAIFISFDKKLEELVMPFAVALKTIPVIAMAPLMVLWFGPGISSKIAVACAICFFPSLVNALRGIKSVDNELIDQFVILKSSKYQMVRYLILPSILPYLMAALKVSSSLAIVGAIAGELISANKGLGFLIIMNYYSMNIPLVFATIVVLSMLGISLYYVLELIEQRNIKWCAVN